MAFAIALTDEQWELVADLFDPPGRRGAPAVIPRRQMVDAMLFIARNGIQRRYLPRALRVSASAGKSSWATWLMTWRLTLVWTVKSKSSRVFVAGNRAALTQAVPPWLSRVLTSVAGSLGQPAGHGPDPGRLERP
jgi:transposase